MDRRPEIAALASRYRFTDRVILTGRGYAYATAEAALKLMETSYVAAHAFSGADLLHGPLAMIDQSHPVVAVVPDGAGATAMRPVLERMSERDADLLVLGGPQAVGYGTVSYPLEPLRGPRADRRHRAAAVARARDGAGPGLRPGRPPRAGEGHPHPVRVSAGGR